jgi:phosphate:Na+ symporter
MIKQIIFGTIGGLGLLIYGIQLMGDGLQQVAGDRMRKILSTLTNNALMGVMVGAVVTSIIQSSSATTVLLVGFINAGLITLRQAVGVIMGANIGTTITAQIIALKLTDYALPAIGVGFGVMFFSRRMVSKSIGRIILGFGLLFLGLSTMSGAVKFLRGHQAVKDFMLSLSTTPLLGVLVGILVTVAIQSSSASVGLLLSLAGSGLIDLPTAIPILLGDNIGTCVTAVIASIGTSVSAKRAAAAHTAFNIIGTAIILLLLPYYETIIRYTAVDISHQIANAHTLFNVVNTVILFPFISLLIKLVTKIIPGEEQETPNYLDERLLNTPVLALDQAKSEVSYMGDTVCDMLTLAITGLFNKDYKLFQKVGKKEQVTDVLEKDISHYLVRISQRRITPKISQRLSSFMHIINDLERIGDHSENLTKLSQRLLDGRMGFSPTAMEEIHRLYDKTSRFVKDAVTAIKNDDRKLARDSFKYEREVDQMVAEYRQNHINRLNDGSCKVIPGLIFVDMLNNFEKIGDHAYNICEAVLGLK